MTGEPAVALARPAGAPREAEAPPSPEAREHTELASPGPGYFRIAVAVGDAVRPGTVLGQLEALGRLTTVAVPPGVRGVVVETCARGRARPPVDHGAALVVIAPATDATDADAGRPDAAPVAPAAIAGRVFRAPMSGRFYGRPAPDRPPFVAAGDALEPGAAVCLLEVMKTFLRVTYTGEPARLRAVLVADGADVTAGDPVLALE
jgi:acetyl-CoA carboxylase biotin carboxyl carrier protein